MALGKKTGGGTRKGSPNKLKAAVAERIAALGCDPFEGMATIAMDMSNPPELRGRMHAELAQYLSPKLRSVEQTSEITHRYVARVPNTQPEMSEWQRQHADALKTKTPTLQ